MKKLILIIGILITTIGVIEATMLFKPCYSCGSVSACNSGDPNIQVGWSNCIFDPNGNCIVYGLYGPCGEGDTGPIREL